MPKWTRTFDSAQRRIVIETPRGPLSFERIEVEIQGLVVTRDGLTETYAFSDMADYGVHAFQEPPLKIWERLLRRASRIGELRLLPDGQLAVRFWTQPLVELHFKLEDPREAALLEELEIMCLSGGFHFRDLREDEV